MPRGARGEKNGLAKLTEEQVAEARRLRAEDKYYWTYPKLAEKYGVARPVIRAAIVGLTWEHVETRPADVKKQTKYRTSRGGRPVELETMKKI